jgi:hypothetical protein
MKWTAGSIALITVICALSSIWVGLLLYFLSIGLRKLAVWAGEKVFSGLDSMGKAFEKWTFMEPILRKKREREEKKAAEAAKRGPIIEGASESRV